MKTTELNEREIRDLVMLNTDVINSYIEQGYRIIIRNGSGIFDSQYNKIEYHPDEDLFLSGLYEIHLMKDGKQAKCKISEIALDDVAFFDQALSEASAMIDNLTK